MYKMHERHSSMRNKYIYTQLFSNAQYSDSWTIHEELSSKCIIQLNRTDIFMPMTSTLRRIPTLPRMLKSSRQGLAESINLGPPWGASFCVKYSYIIFNARSKHCLFSCLPSTSSRGPFPVSKSDIYISHVPLGGQAGLNVRVAGVQEPEALPPPLYVTL